MARFYITTPIYYVNDVPHVGSAYTTVNCDAIARWHRLLGDDVFFLTGTDEHGLKIQRAAEAQGLSPREMADRTSERFREAWNLLEASYDRFIRTTDPDHYAAVSTLLEKVYENGDIELGTYEGLYCVPCEAYYTADELLPDESGAAGAVGLCPVHLRPVEIVTEENYFFKLSRYQDALLEWYEANPDAVQPESRRNEAIGFIRQGLLDFSISRTSIAWGVPIPWDPRHVTYVWFDALTNYLTAVGYGTDPQRFEAWWPNVHHVIGKDILRFHCVYWPAMLLAAGVTPPKLVFAHGFLLAAGEKISKSGTKVTAISPEELTEDFGVEPIRYHLVRDVSFGNDGDFSYEGVVARYNADLANNLGNLVARVSTVVEKKCGGIGPRPDPDSVLAAVAATVYKDAADAWERFAPNDALEATWRLIRETNAYLETNEPWKAEPGDAVDRVMGDALEALRIIAVLASPAMPRTCDEIWRRIGCEGSIETVRVPDAVTWGLYPGGVAVERGAPLFPRR